MNPKPFQITLGPYEPYNPINIHQQTLNPYNYPKPETLEVDRSLNSNRIL